MKRIASLFLVMCLLLCGCSQVGEVKEKEDVLPKNEVKTREREIVLTRSDDSAAEEEQEIARDAEETESPTVYRTRAGEKYHKEGCYYLKSKIKTTVEEATDMGLTPCSRCKPPRE